MAENKIIGYTAGVFDLFHYGHILHLKNAKSLCDYLIVGVSSDKLIKNVKKKKNIMSYFHRYNLVDSCKYVDLVVPQHDFNRYNIWKKLKFNITFIGEDWYGNSKFMEIENKLTKAGVKVIFFPYTEGISSTSLKEVFFNKNAK